MFYLKFYELFIFSRCLSEGLPFLAEQNDVTMNFLKAGVIEKKDFYKPWFHYNWFLNKYDEEE